MRKLYQKLIEYGMKLIVEPYYFNNSVYIYFEYACYVSDPVRISIDFYDKEYPDLEELLLFELETFRRVWIK